MYLYDLKVSGAYRGQHIGQKLIERSKEAAISQNYRGLYTQGQDDDPGACLFYLNNGFTSAGWTPMSTSTPRRSTRPTFSFIPTAESRSAAARHPVRRRLFIRTA